MKFVAALTVPIVLIFGLARPIDAGVPERKPPKSCLTALRHSEAITKVTGTTFQDVGAFFSAVHDAAAAGAASGDVNAFLAAETAASNTLTGQINDATDRVLPEIAAYKAAAKRCRAGQ